MVPLSIALLATVSVPTDGVAASTCGVTVISNPAPAATPSSFTSDANAGQQPLTVINLPRPQPAASLPIVNNGVPTDVRVAMTVRRAPGATESMGIATQEQQDSPSALTVISAPRSAAGAQSFPQSDGSAVTLIQSPTTSVSGCYKYEIIVKGIILAAGLLVLSATSEVNADVLCQGTVNFVDLTSDGDLLVDFGYKRVNFCNVNITENVSLGGGYPSGHTVTPATCQALLASFTTAKSMARPVQVASTRSDCNFVDGAFPNPYPYQMYFLQ